MVSSLRLLGPALFSLAMACTNDPGEDDAADEVGTESDGTDTQTETEEDEDTGDGLCGNGVIDEGEICDDGNNTTEYPPYAAEDCIDDCSMVLATCNDGVLDPGEDCDDGNADSKDECTTSCSFNDMGVHAACTVFIDGEEVTPQFNISQGEIMNCDAVEPATGSAVGCNRSWTYVGNNEVFAPGGDCQMISLECEGGSACPPGPIGDYDAHTSCPAGHVLVGKTIEGDGVVVPTIHSKVCLKDCESDRDCRWNEHDDYWRGPGEYRCQVTPISGGETVCNDARNDAL